MSNQIEVGADLKPVAYAWPGGYPVFYLSRDGWRDADTGVLDFLSDRDGGEAVTCPVCAGKRDQDLILVAADVNWEDADLHCEICEARIESAYGEDAKGSDAGEDKGDGDGNG